MFADKRVVPAGWIVVLFSFFFGGEDGGGWGGGYQMTHSNPL